MQIVDSISAHILSNSYLLHIDLSHNGLKNDELLVISEAIRKSKSLRSVHLSGNNMNKSMKEKII